MFSKRFRFAQFEDFVSGPSDPYYLHAKWRVRYSFTAVTRYSQRPNSNLVKQKKNKKRILLAMKVDEFGIPSSFATTKCDSSHRTL